MSILERLFVDRHLDFLIETVDAAWSRHEVRARVVDIIEETHDVKSFVLRPNGRWKGHRAGQFVPLAVEIDGVRVRRTYSLSSPPANDLLAITVKRVPGGRVSNWLHENVSPGDVLRLGPAAGEFVLPETPGPLLFLSGGSGITPVMSMLRELASRGTIEDVVFVHYAKSRADLIFGAELAVLAACNPGVKILTCLDGEGSGFDEVRLACLVPDFAQRDTYLCGPAGLMDRVDRMWRDAGAADRLRHERFVAPRPRIATGTAPVEVRCGDRAFTGTTSAVLLEQLEAAGERPAFGCRLGICKTCTRKKRSGTVENLLTGAVSSEPDEDIQPCISIPRSDLELA